MCKKRPGNRCTGHANASLQSAQKHAQAAVAAYQDAEQSGQFDFAPNRQQEARKRVARTRDRLTRKVLDYDATPAGIRQLREAIAATTPPEGAKPKAKKKLDTERATLTTRLDAAKTLRAERTRLHRAMPAAPATPALSAKQQDLGNRLDQVAIARAEAVRARSEPGSNDVHQHRIADSEREAFAADYGYRFHANGGVPDPNHLSPAEVRALSTADVDARRQLSLLSHMRGADGTGTYGATGADHVDTAEDQVHDTLGWNDEPTTASPTSGAGRGAGTAHPTRRKGMFSGRRSSRGGRGQLMQEVRGMAPVDSTPARAGAQQNGDVILGGLQT